MKTPDLPKIPHFIGRTVKGNKSHFHLTVLIYSMIGKLTCHRKKEKLFSTFVTKTKAYKGKNPPPTTGGFEYPCYSNYVFYA